MERIELFDRYINNQLSEKEREEFNALLKSDEDFASDFNVYLFTVDGICREVQQDNIDFGVAMKKLSQEQLRSIIGIKTEAPETKIAAFQSRDAAIVVKTEAPVKTKILHFKTWTWQTASIAAIFVVVLGMYFNIEKNARYAVDNAIYACADINPDLVRAGGESIDITSMTDDELESKLSELESLYQSASTNDEIADNGYALAMAYLRLHDRDKAKSVLNQLVTKFEDNADFDDSVKKWKSILNLLK